ncbi:MAG TPA: hypothetical protein P5120_11530 [Spirochaetota bacterium]|nr:hypothetical protein [Spirochaetota bacterium]HPF06481.1 hypothetical protein [Spirochaetota bacterium]HPR38813.1 hypothetical protein [Spirochaetota bacterium]HRX48141.1 hypothetical protein [Spirochaetota bacterium]
MLTRTLIERVYEGIKSFNCSEYDPSVPMSDQFMKDFTSAEGYSESETKHALMILNEAHKVFIIAITKESKQSGNKKIDGYVVADLSVVSNLRSIYQKRLTEIYNKEKGTNLGPPQVMREVMNRMNTLVNTPVGRVANIAIMLHEYENLMDRYPQEFTEEWCEEKLQEYLDNGTLEEEQEEGAADESSSAAGEKSGTTRAVDSPEYEDYTRDDKTLPPHKMLMIYGADFFFRVKLRKYEFNILRDMIREGHIKRKTDIVLLRNMIKTIKGNFDRDPKLNDYFEDIFHLDRELSKKLYFSAK